MPIPPEVIQSIRERVNIVELVGESVTLKRKGNSHVGLCPFHQEKTPSFNVVPGKNIFHCFGCGEGGDGIAFVMKTRGVGFIEAVKELGQRVGVEVEDRQLTEVERRRITRRANLFDVCEAAAGFYHSTLMTRPEGRPALEYLRGRGLTEETIAAFRLGFAPARWDGVQEHLARQGFDRNLMASAGLIRWRDERNPGRGSYDLFRGRVMVPILNERGKVVAFGGRVLESLFGTSDAIREGAPKYVNSPETEAYRKKQVLYGLHQARRAIQNRNRILVVEGYFDVIALHQAGFEEAVATCGTALTPEHARLIRPLTQTVVALFDTDEAGLRAAEKSMPIFVKAGIEPYRLVLVGAKDPDEFIQVNGRDEFAAALARPESLLELLLTRTRGRHGASPQGKQRTVEDLAPIVRLYESAAQQAVIGRLSSALALSESVIREWVGRARAGTPDRSDPTAAQVARWNGSKALNQLFWLLIHHHDLVAPEIVIADPDPDVITDYEPAQVAFAMLLKGDPITAIMDFVDDENIRRVLIAAASRETLIPAANAKNAVRQNLDSLLIVRIDQQLQELQTEIAACNNESDTSSYFSLIEKLQALQKRKHAIQTRFAQ